MSFDEIKDWILPVINFIFVIYMLMYIRRKPKSKSEDPLTENNLKLTSREELVMRKFEDQMDLKFENLDREFSSRLGNRITALNLLVQEADKKLSQVSVEDHASVKSGGRSPLEKKLPLTNPTRSEIHAKVSELYSAGLSSKEIASHLKMLEGEVNLITSIIKKKQDE